MTSFVENESQRRTQNNSKLLLSAELITADGSEPIYLMELTRESCRAIVSNVEPKGSVTLRVPLPNIETIDLRARVTWTKLLASKKWHVCLDEFEFKKSSEKQSLISYLNEIEVESQDLGVRALKALGTEELKRLSRLVKASRTLDPCQSYIELLKQIIDVTRRALGAERGLFLVDRGDEELAVEVARGAKALEERGIRFSTTVTSTVQESNQPLLSLDALTDKSLDGVSSIKMLGTVSVMCIPLSSENRHFGFLYLDNSMSKGLFRDSDLALATVIADLASSALQKNLRYQHSLQSERVSATRSLLSGLSRDLLPSLHRLEETCRRLRVETGSETFLAAAKEKAKSCVEAVEALQAKAHAKRVEKEHLDLMNIFEDIAFDVGDDVEFPLPPPSGWPKIKANSQELANIIRGLVSSAVRDQAGQTRVSIAHRGEMMKITVLNQDLSLSNREMSRILEPFVDHSLNPVQKLVHEQNGLLRVHANPAGGTAFTADLPLQG